MDDNGGLGMRHWGGYYEQPPMKGGLSLQLMSAGERDLKPFLPNAAFLHRDCSVQEHSAPMEYMRESWMYHQRDHNSKMLHTMPMNPNYAVPLDAHSASNPHTLQMLEQPDVTTQNEAPAPNDPANVRKRTRPKKKSGEIDSHKVPKPKKPKKVPAQRDGVNNNNNSNKSNNSSVLRGKGVTRSAGVVINGIDLDISQLPTPVCSCTGNPQPCYRWGIGGWQSACCTTNISMYPLPMSTKRQGARIAGRKMSHGAFKKVLEKLTGEGYDLSNPIDLRAYWAKHGTNKFVTIR
uniref:GAGA-binding transcriptional activator n=1 Tax=Anthurium amnicola TaxID=1678845 RepID=A0A1D1YN12_9ARAE